MKTARATEGPEIRRLRVKTGLLAGPALCLFLSFAQADEIGRIKGAVGDADIERAGETIKPKPGLPDRVAMNASF